MEEIETKKAWHVIAIPSKTFVSGHSTEKEAWDRARQENRDAELSNSESRYAVMPRGGHSIPTGWASLGP